ncbi:MAG: NUDIX domain-containing protein [Bacteroidota bacterium]
MAFNIRIYGLLIDENRRVLLSDERRFGKAFTKFPGGGLEQGEGTVDCLKREFKEELDISVAVGELFYLTDFYQPSAFNADDQIISVYYFVHYDASDEIPTRSKPFDFSGEEQESNRWVPLKDLSPKDVTFPIDQLVVRKLVEEIS